MTINRNRLAIVVAVFWGISLIPLTHSLPNTYEIISRLLWILLFLWPIWLIYSWRWVSDEVTLPYKLWFIPILLCFGVIYLLTATRMSSTFSILTLLSCIIYLGMDKIHGNNRYFEDTKQNILPRLKNPPFWLLISLITGILVWGDSFATRGFTAHFTISIAIQLAAMVTLFGIALKVSYYTVINHFWTFSIAIILSVVTFLGIIGQLYQVHQQEKRNAQIARDVQEQYRNQQKLKEQQKCERIKETFPSLYAQKDCSTWR